MSDLVVERAVPLERHSIFTLLGIRFWDPVLDEQVREGLEVRAWPEGSPDAATTAFRTGTGIYAFRGLYGLRHLEYPQEGTDPWEAETSRFTVEARDSRSRFHPLVFTVDVPFRGIFPADAVGSPVDENSPGCWLFSSPSRSQMSSAGVLRAHLVEAETEEPAAYARLEAEIGGEQWHGLAGADGQVALFFPLPDFTSPLGFTSPVAPMPPQSWHITVRAFYEPARQEIPQGATFPDVRSLFNQAPRDIWLTEGGMRESELALDFGFRTGPVLRTGIRPYLWLDPVTSPP